jgi:hypothetical protein
VNTSKKKPQISPLRYAPVEMTNQLHKKLCHLDRSVPGFPATRHRTERRVRLSERRMQCINAIKFNGNPG